MEVLLKIYKDIRDKATVMWSDRLHSGWEPKLTVKTFGKTWRNLNMEWELNALRELSSLFLLGVVQALWL